MNDSFIARKTLFGLAVKAIHQRDGFGQSDIFLQTSALMIHQCSDECHLADLRKREMQGDVQAGWCIPPEMHDNRLTWKRRRQIAELWTRAGRCSARPTYSSRLPQRMELCLRHRNPRRWAKLKTEIERYIFFSLVNGVLTRFHAKVMELGGLLVQITHVQVTFSCTLKYPFLIR